MKRQSIKHCSGESVCAVCCVLCVWIDVVSVQIGTTKGTGGDVLILEEAAYCDEGFFYEVSRFFPPLL